MPSRPTNLNSFANSNEPSKDYIECTLINQDGTPCRKRCFNEKKYRSMQEHIRRAHSEHYIPKLPATEESVLAMMASAAHAPIDVHDSSPQQHAGWHDHLDGATDDWTNGVEGHGQDNSSYATSSMFSPNHFRRGSMLQTANAATALAQLSHSRPETDWHGTQDAFGDPENEHEYMANYFAHEGGVGAGGQDMFADHQQQHDMSSHMTNNSIDRSYSARAASSQPFGRRPNRPRKSSVTENARKGKHERDRSKDLKRFSHDRKGLSQEPNNQRWEELLEAASAAGDSKDLTPIPQSPRSSMPPFDGQTQNQYQSYTTSPLQNTLLPQESTEEQDSSFNNSGLEAFPSVESSYDPVQGPQPYQHQHQSSGDSAHSQQAMYPPYSQHRHHASSGANFHMPPEGLNSSSPGQSRPQTHDGSHNPNHNNAFARPRSSTTNNTPHFPHPLNAAHLAQQTAAVQQHQNNYGQQHPPPGPWTAHHNSFSQSASGASSDPSSANPNRGGQMQDFPSPPVQHYCASCNTLTPLSTSFACTECISGFCNQCADILKQEGHNRRNGCPKCHSAESRFKLFQLDLK